MHYVFRSSLFCIREFEFLKEQSGKKIIYFGQQSKVPQKCLKKSKTLNCMLKSCQSLLRFKSILFPLILLNHLRAFGIRCRGTSGAAGNKPQSVQLCILNSPLLPTNIWHRVKFYFRPDLGCQFSPSTIRFDSELPSFCCYQDGTVSGGSHVLYSLPLSRVRQDEDGWNVFQAKLILCFRPVFYRKIKVPSRQMMFRAKKKEANFLCD